ncbi:MAG: MFS transporter [Thermomicrobiales bacterium]
MIDNDIYPATSEQAARGTGIRRFYAFKLMTEMQFTGGIWILYLKHQGLSLAEIGLAESAFHLAPVLFELPSGSFADLVGRRWSLAIGGLLIAVSSLLLFFADTLPIAMLALFLNGASYSFRSGADQAYLYDSLGDRRETFGSILGKLMGVSYLVGGETIWLGASLSEISYSWPIGIAAATGLAGAWLATGLTEGRAEPGMAAQRSARDHARDAVQVLKERPGLVAVLLFSGGFWTANTIAFLYFQAAFSDRGLSNSAIGFALAAGMVLTALGSAAAGRVEHRVRFSRQLSVLAILSGLGTAGVALDPLVVAVAAYLAANLATGLLDPLIFSWYNHQVPSGQRATLISVDSWLFSMTMIVSFPLAGWAAGHEGWAPVYLACGAAQIGLTFFLLLVRLRRSRHPESTFRIS